jgi:hypothetical protein
LANVMTLFVLAIACVKEQEQFVSVWYHQATLSGGRMFENGRDSHQVQIPAFKIFTDVPDLV